MNAVLIGLLAYSVGLIGLGVWIGRRVGTAGGFFVADRKLGALLIFATVLAANIGAGSTVGAAGLGYRDGLSAWWWVGWAGIGTLVLAFTIGPRIWQVASDNGLLTVGDYLDHRYGPSVRGVVAVLLLGMTVAVIAGQLIAMAEILDVVADIPRWLGALIGGVVITVYFVSGGLLSSAWVNLVQLGVLLVGFAIAVPWALSAAGGWEAIAQAGVANGKSGYLNFLQGGSSGWWIYLPLIAPAFIVSPGIVQKAFGAVDAGVVRVGLAAAGVALMAFAFLPPLIGMTAHALDPSLVRQELALPTLLVVGLPPAVGMIALAAVFSAELSSADAGLFMLSTSLSRDLFKRFLKPDASDAQVLRVARFGALLGGTAGVALAVILPTVIASLTIFYALLSVSLFVPVVAGLYTRRTGAFEALAAIGAGLSALAAVTLLGPENPKPFMDRTSIGLGVSALAFVVVALVRRGSSRAEGEVV